MVKFQAHALLFDLDATLIDSRPIYEQAFGFTFEEVLGISLNEHERRQFMGLPTIEYLMQYAEGDRLNELESTLTRHIKALMPEVRLFVGFDRVLPRLREAGLQVGIVTSQTRAESMITRQVLGIDAWVDVWVTADDVERVKPDPEPVEAALRALGLEARQVVFIGDSVYDMKAGQAAGVRVGVAVWGTADLELLLSLKPDYVFQTPTELLAFTGSGWEDQAGT